MNVKANLEKMLKTNGASLVGFSDVTSVPAGSRADLPSAITIAVALDKDVVRTIQDAPTREYYEEYKRINALLDRLGILTADFLRNAGYMAKVLPTTDVKSNDVLVTDFPHKTGGVLSGLGWIGKCALLITRQYGSAVRLTTVFTDLLTDNSEPMKNLCGDCKECVSACPGNAIMGRNWSEGVDRSEIYDAFACQKAAHAQAAKIDVKNTICGVCMASCPWTKWYLK